ncbi:hypothetical protein E2C01_005370 [Portunus trituberculatus]|uniref:Uncharacterized protein n=1 Tax=Portunus trituberculatus TaxID=210409 RepID=A0A5B7CWH1_PORTR|nr:hypothetical protein [Portunus trituberculatus]
MFPSPVDPLGAATRDHVPQYRNSSISTFGGQFSWEGQRGQLRGIPPLRSSSTGMVGLGNRSWPYIHCKFCTTV